MRPSSSSYDTAMTRTTEGFRPIRERLERGELVDYADVEDAIDEYGDAGWHDLCRDLEPLEVPGEGYRMAAKVSQAEAWLAEHGFDDGAIFGNSAGQRIGDLLRSEPSCRQDRLWLYETDPLEATPVEVHLWDDGSGVIITDGWWDVVVGRGHTGSDAYVLSDLEMDQEAERAAPAGYTIQRGAYQGTTDDRADRWYWQWADDDTVDRRGPGYATLQEVLDRLEEELPLLARRLREARAAAELTQQGVADAIGAHRPTYVAYETGRRTPNVETLAALAGALGVTMDWLAGRE